MERVRALSRDVLARGQWGRDRPHEGSRSDGPSLQGEGNEEDAVRVDEQASYDPCNGDDKLLLDFKGTLSEAELRGLSLRLRGAQNSKARRGQ